MRELVLAVTESQDSKENNECLVDTYEFEPQLQAFPPILHTLYFILSLYQLLAGFAITAMLRGYFVFTLLSFFVSFIPVAAFIIIQTGSNRRFITWYSYAVFAAGALEIVVSGVTLIILAVYCCCQPAKSLTDQGYCPCSFINGDEDTIHVEETVNTRLSISYAAESTISVKVNGKEQSR
ncbi:uncharacterized protein TRIADDRAFT_62182 [Trichoplax adhaerens]|uniref:Uncharacterized protein n=1 Tax=Trichoplax adhaerens TaxID=10228 RepID=B3SD25_TRIAD|nr:predicted protein [Trichoplax adhaerens]EDV19384.1 predicted protein [Trichoplax adhaerens]|eukprot:XP_002118159.1 predicted protein [Trichoplax adhaerens]